MKSFLVLFASIFIFDFSQAEDSQWKEVELFKFNVHFTCDNVWGTTFLLDTRSGEAGMQTFCETIDYSGGRDPRGHRWQLRFDSDALYMDYSNPKKFYAYAKTENGDVLCAKRKKPHKWYTNWKFTGNCKFVTSREKSRKKRTKTGKKYREYYRKVWLMVRQ